MTPESNSPAERAPFQVTLLGPQRHPTVGKVVRSLGFAAPIVTVTAGWQERESDDGELDDLLDGRSRNLRLYERWGDVQNRDPELARAMRRRRDLLQEVRETYLLRLRHALAAVEALQPEPDGAVITAITDHASDAMLGTADEITGSEARATARNDARLRALEDVRRLDRELIERLDELNDMFIARWRPHERDAVAAHRAAVVSHLDEAGGVALAGGHVGVLLALVHLFAVRLPARLPVVAWSAGAMALTEQVVLFHDRATVGPSDAEVYGRGLGVVPGIVALPHARRRLLLSDAARMSLLAQRFSAAQCVLLDDGARVDLDSDGGVPAVAPVLGRDGHLSAEPAA